MSVESASSADSIPKDQLQAQIFKLKMDHFEELFDWLSLRDLVVLSKTCKRMQHIVGYYIKTNYAATKFECTVDGIHASDDYATERVSLSELSFYLKKLAFDYLEMIQYDHWGHAWEELTDICIPHLKAGRFESLTEILLKRIVFTDEGISRIKEILGQLETVKLKFPHFHDGNNEFYESFLQFCTKMKKLCIQGDPTIGIDNSWLRRKYPKLEHFELTADGDNEISELEIFFKQNANIKNLATSIEDIVMNRNVFTNTELKLDVFSVKFARTETFESARDVLNELYGRGLFKQLHVYFFTLYDSTFDQNSVNHLVSFDGLTKLAVEGVEDDTDLSSLVNLKYLCINYSPYISNKMDVLAQKLVHLEFIQFTIASVNDILQFIRYAPKLSTMVVFRFTGTFDSNLNVNELNEERSKLTNAKKLTIYLAENFYLALKWMKNQTNWSFIEIKRGASYEALNQSFDFMDDPDMKF